MRQINLNHFIKGILVLVLLSGQLVGQSNVVVTVFNQPGLNGTVGSCSNENENLIEIINAIPGYTVDGTAIVNFTNTSALQTALDNAQFFFMTDMETGNPNLTSFLPNAAKTILHDFVDDGGVIVQTGTFGNNDHDFLNQIFGWNLTRATGSSWAKVSANTVGTPFDAVSGTSLPYLSATDAINKNSVPNFTTMYGTDANAVVAVIQYGSGYVIFLGYDYYNTGLNPSVSSPCAAYSGIWVQEVIPAALAYATQLSSSSVDNITETTADFDYDFSENATTYYVVVPSGSTAPTEAQIKAGVDYGTVTLVDDGSATTTANTIYTFALSGLTSCSDYDVYAVSEWNDSGTLKFSSIESTSFSTVDLTPPSIAVKNITVALDPSTNTVVVTPGQVDDGTTDNCGTPTLSLSKSTFTCSDVGANTVTLTATDAEGLTSSSTVTITVTKSPVVFSAPSDVAVTTDINSCVATSVSLGSANITGQCYTVTNNAPSSYPIGSTTVTWTLTESDGTITTDDQLVVVQDTVNPVLVLNTGVVINLDASGTTTLSISDVDNGSYDDCGLTHLSFASGSLNSSISYSCSDEGSQTVNVYALDDSGNESVTTFTFTVADIIAPTVTTTSPTLYLDVNSNATLTTSDIITSVVENCSVASTVLSKTSFNCGDVGSNTVTITITDVNGNATTATETVTIVDAVAPDIHVTDVQVSLGSDGTVVVTPSSVDDGTTDACGSLVWTLSDNTFDCSDIGSHLETATVTDVNGNSSTAYVIITVSDNIAPTVVTQSATLYLNSMGMATLDTADVISSATDNCGISSMSLSNTSFGCTDIGTNQVTLNVTDGSNNTASSVVSVTVLDTITPTITMADTVTVYANATCGASATWAVLADDNCSYTISSNYASGSTFNIGYHNVITTVTDPSGNAASTTTVIEVLDTLAPVWTSSSFVNSIVPNTASCGSFVTWIAPVAFDLCSSVSVTASATNGASFGLGTHTVTFTATDAAGNSNTQSITFTVVDDIAPEVVVPTDITVNNDAGQCGASVTYAAPFALDNCNLDTVYYSHAPGSYFSVGQTQVTATAHDAAGNISSGMFTITVVDTEAPTLVSVPNDTTLGFCNASFVYPTPSFDDNCGVFSVTLISGIASGNVFPVGTTENIYVATDVHGNTDTVAFNVTVINQYPATLPFYGLVCSNSPNFDLTAGDSSLVFSGNYVTNNLFSPSTSGPGEHNLVYAFTDSLGCVSYGTLTLTVEEAPTMPVVQRLGANYLTTQHYDQYQWYLNGNPIPGATSQNLVASVAGNYKVKVWNTAGCSRISAIMAVGSVGLDEVSVDDLKVYPNPSQGLFSIDMTGINGDITLKIYDSMGRFISEQTLESGLVQMIDMSNASSGMYQLVLVDSDGHVVVRRVTIQK